MRHYLSRFCSIENVAHARRLWLRYLPTNTFTLLISQSLITITRSVNSQPVTQPIKSISRYMSSICMVHSKN